MIALRREELPFFKWAILFSLIAHFLLFMSMFLSPSFFNPQTKEPVYYVSLMSLPGGGSGKNVSAVKKGKSLKELTKYKAEETENKLRYPDSEKKKERKIQSEKDKKKVIAKSGQSLKTSYDKGELTTGIGSGGSGVGIGFGEGTGLSNFPYTYYVLIIRDKVSNNWYTSLIAPDFNTQIRTVVYFRILRNGRISDVKVEESSGVKSFDLSALRAIYSSAPFPPLPQGFEGDYLGVHFIFEHSK